MGEVPSIIKPVLKRVGDADTFQMVGDNKPIAPPGKFVISYPYIEGNVGIAAGGIGVLPIIKPEQVSTNSGSFQELVKWVVGRSTGFLDSIAFFSNTPLVAIYQLTIKKNVIFTGKKIQQILSLDLLAYDLKEGDVILLEVKSDGATTILSDGLIQGREV